MNIPPSTGAGPQFGALIFHPAKEQIGKLQPRGQYGTFDRVLTNADTVRDLMENPDTAPEFEKLKNIARYDATAKTLKYEPISDETSLEEGTVGLVIPDGETLVILTPNIPAVANLTQRLGLEAIPESKIDELTERATKNHYQYWIPTLRKALNNAFKAGTLPLARQAWTVARTIVEDLENLSMDQRIKAASEAKQ